jgi:peptidoglycan/LPS O-acetylase OafA/YrhL
VLGGERGTLSFFAVTGKPPHGRSDPVTNRREISMGPLRLFLAIVVAIGHVQSTILTPRGVHLWGGYYLGFDSGYAVMAFYMISGFLISMVLDTKYGHAPTRFYLKRSIRIFSLYLPLAAIAFVFFDGTLRDFRSADFLQRITNFGLLGADWLIFSYGPAVESAWDALPTPLHQAWTLSAELTFYLAAPWLLRSNRAALVALLLSAATRVAIIITVGHDLRWTYFFLPATFLFFLLGHWSRVLALRHATLQRPVVAYSLLFACFAIFSLLHSTWDTTFDSPGFWLAMICLALSLPGLFQHTKDNNLLNWIGALSYPLYLTHNMIRMELESFKVFDYFPPALSGAPLVASYLIAALGGAIAAHLFLETPCARIMNGIAEFALSFSPKKVLASHLSLKSDA